MFLSHDSLGVLVLALLFDALIGDPQRLWSRIPHPVVFMGRLIEALDRRGNDAAHPVAQRRAAGVVTLVILIVVAAAIGWAFRLLCGLIPYGSVLVAFLASVLFAQRSLYDHIKQVATAFANGGLKEARLAVARVVGRDPEALDEAGVSRAAIESCAENFSDGVVAPAFWFALFGLPGLFVYKIVNTADSMIGYKTPRYAAFGWASARCDDLLNLVPARLSGLLISAVAPFAGGTIVQALAVMWRDSGKHRSPNAGWPESAMAGALDLALAGPRQYADERVDEPFLNPQGRIARPQDILRALRILLAACCLELLIYAGLAALI